MHVRDFENEFVYAGGVNSFFETDKLRELVVLDVIVYDFEATKLYDIPRLHLARAPENIHIEFPISPNIGANSMTTKHVAAMDGFSKVRPISEGYLVKGGVNATSQITTRPDAPAPTRPAASQSPTASASPPATTSK